jgi:hypothetical protein
MKTQIVIDHWRGKRLIRLLTLMSTLAVAAPTLFAQGAGHDKHDPTGAWLLQTDLPGAGGILFHFLTVFHEGGTLTGNIQGESAIDPQAVTDPTSDLNILISPHSGVWQKTGRNTFAATWVLMEYRDLTNPEPSSPLFRFDKVQYTGELDKSGATMQISALLTFYNEQGNQIDPPGPTPKEVPFRANGVRIPLEVLPNTGGTLPVPPVPN